MSLLDLQKMEVKAQTKSPSGSRTSKGCNVSSGISLLLCVI